MFYSQNYYEDSLSYRETPAFSYVRIFHASPDAPPVDVYANDKLVAKNISYRTFTQYLKVISGNYNVTIFPTGRKDNPVITSSIYITPGSIFTLIAGDRLANIKLFAVPETVRAIPPGNTMVRFGHLSPGTPNVDITLSDGEKLFKDVSFSQITNYISVRPGTYTFNLVPAGSTKSVLYVPNIQLKANRFYTIYAIGLAVGSPPLQVVIPLDGNSYIKL
jgi:hypothetical protein